MTTRRSQQPIDEPAIKLSSAEIAQWRSDARSFLTSIREELAAVSQLAGGRERQPVPPQASMLGESLPNPAKARRPSEPQGPPPETRSNPVNADADESAGPDRLAKLRHQIAERLARGPSIDVKASPPSNASTDAQPDPNKSR